MRGPLGPGSSVTGAVTPTRQGGEPCVRSRSRPARSSPSRRRSQPRCSRPCCRSLPWRATAGRAAPRTGSTCSQARKAPRGLSCVSALLASSDKGRCYRRAPDPVPRDRVALQLIEAERFGKALRRLIQTFGEPQHLGQAEAILGLVVQRVAPLSGPNGFL